jgi:hypothetical protein
MWRKPLDGVDFEEYIRQHQKNPLHELCHQYKVDIILLLQV